MPVVKCAICGKEGPPSQMKRCNNCEMWLCSGCVKYSLLGAPSCPKCGKPVK